MRCSRNTLLAAIFSLGTLAVAANSSQACGGRSSGGYFGGCSQSYSAPAYNYGYSAPSYGYSQPGYNYSQSSYRNSQPGDSYSQGIPQQPEILNQPLPQEFVQPRFAQQQGLQQSPMQLISQPHVQTPQQMPRQQTAQPHVQTPQQLPRQQTAQPQIQTPQQMPRQQQSPPQTPNSTQMSALQALGGFAAPQNLGQQGVGPQSVGQQNTALQNPGAPQTSIQAPVHVGNWTATLGNGARVQLSLQADGNFSWTATSQNGTASSFSGSFSVVSGQLVLNRSNDNQQLGGSLSISGSNAFSFQVAGTNAAAISFSRN